MAAEENKVVSFSVASVVEDVLQQNNLRPRVVDMASRKAEEASFRRNEAAVWLRKTVGVVGGKDLPTDPSEEDFRLALRSGIILCNAVNKVQPGAVPKIVEAPSDSLVTPDGAALSAFQYFENIRNFHVAMEEIGLPTFEACDLEKGGKSVRIVNCVLALKSYSEWKQSGGTGSWRCAVNMKPPVFGAARSFARKSSEPFMNSFSRTKSLDSRSGEQSLYGDLGQDFTEGESSRSITAMVRAVLSDKKHEEIPMVVESVLNKVMEEFEHRLAVQNEMMKASSKEASAVSSGDALSRTSSSDLKDDGEDATEIKEEDDSESKCLDSDKESENHLLEQQIMVQNYDHDEKLTSHFQKQQLVCEKQQRYILELKQNLNATKAGMRFLQMKFQEEFVNLGKKLHGLAYAASGYTRVLEENRKLYNQVQDLKGNIRVYCRVRPFLPGQPDILSTVERIEEGTITITTPLKYVKEGRKLFTFNKVFGPAATQEEVFSDTQPLIRSVLDGYNVCIFAYGQTGSGKTYTMTGPKELTEEGLGVNYRALMYLFLLSNERKDTICYDISVQMLEIYNEQVRDLLTTDGQNRRLEIRNSSQNGINVPDAKLVPVSSSSDVIYLMNLGQKNRAVSATAMNDRSSRSHICLTVHVQGRDLQSGNTLRGSMHLVDLAGSERVDKSEVTGDRLKEAQHINKSLSALGDVISSLAQKNSHVPYRNSKLTQLLQDSLGGQAKTLMFVHISPGPEAVGETISTLKFAERVGTVELGTARINKESTEVKELKEQIASLKAAFARKEGEPEDVQLPRSPAPDRLMRGRSPGSSPHKKSTSVGNIPSGRRQQMEDLSGTEVLSNSPSSRRHSLDSSWLSPSLDAKDDDTESTSSDWTDKVVLNKHGELSKYPNSPGSWEAENRRSPDKFFQSCNKDNSKQEFDEQRLRYEGATTDESDDGRASDCSETDLMWQLNVQLNMPRVSSTPNGLAGKTKKNQLRTVKSADTRSLIPSLIPQPTRRLPSTVSPGVQRSGSQHGIGEGKRKTGHGK